MALTVTMVTDVIPTFAFPTEAVSNEIGEELLWPEGEDLPSNPPDMESLQTGNGIAPEDIVSEIPAEETDSKDSEAPILEEIDGKREENIKHFLTADHTYLAAVYPSAVHYEEDGVWKDIDNTLQLQESGEETYYNIFLMTGLYFSPYDIMPLSRKDGGITMGRKASTLVLTPEDRDYLEQLTRTRTIQAQTVNRARILLLKADGISVDAIADKVGLNRKSVMLCISKYNAGGVENALLDAPGRGRNAEITDDEKAWIINIACQKPADFGYAAETWTYAKLTSHINKNAESAGHTRLSTIHKSTVHTILDEAEIKPFRIKYYCENRDPEFDSKMHNVLLVYKQLSMQFDEAGNLIPWEDDTEVVHVLSYDEKPGIQAIATTSEDLLPDENHGTISRDYEYKRLGTLSLLAGIDLQTGEAIPLVSETHNSKDYIAFLKLLDDKYPKGDKIRIVLDNLRVHTSEETRTYLATVPGRFEFVFTPKHGSWLNMVEGFFSKMTKQMLRGIRVKSKAELTERIYCYFREINEEPVVFHWKYNLEDVDVSEEVIIDTLPLLKKSS